MRNDAERGPVEDHDVLAWVGRFRFVTATLIAERFGISVQRTRRRLRRLEAEGFVARERAHLAEDYAVYLTGAGAARMHLPRRRPPRVHVQREHELAIARLASQLELTGTTQVETERECRQREARDEGRRSVDLWGHRGDRQDRKRWPDLVVTRDGRLTAIEIEFAPKGTKRLEGIVNAYVQSLQYDAVRFLVRDPPLANRLTKIVDDQIETVRRGIFAANRPLDITVSPWPTSTQGDVLHHIDPWTNDRVVRHAGRVDSSDMASRELKLKRDDVCAACARGLATGEVAYWDSAAKTVTCLECRRRPVAVAPAAEGEPDLDRGEPGASLVREHDRRRTQREQATRERHPHLGNLLLAVRSPPQHETAFLSGAQGERQVAESLERRTQASSAVLLHNRRMPKGRGDIDHIAIAPSGVFVIDAKNHKTGKVAVATPLFGKSKLLIAGRDHTSLIDGLDRQVAAVREVLNGAACDVPVTGVLCFTQAELPMLTTLKMRSHLLLYRKALAKRINAPGPAGPEEIARLGALLASRLPRA